MPKTKEKQQEIVEPFWRDSVAVLLEFTATKFGHTVPFLPTEARPLKNILKRLREQSNERQVAWTREICTRTLSAFLQWAWKAEPVPHTEKFFLIYASKYKEEILETIRLYKLAKQ
jgi:hypothetical protein